MAKYAVRFFDEHLNPVSATNELAALNLQRRKNSAHQITINYVLGTGPDEDLTIARNLCVYRAGEQVFAGRITDRDFAGGTLEAGAMGHEDRLAGMVTPHRWQGWNGMDLADMARDLLRRFRLQRFTSQDDWEAAHELDDVNTTIEPGSVMLATEPYFGGERFVEHGAITLRLDLGNKAQTTGRIVRWAERSGDPTRITVQSRAADTEEDLDEAEWGPELTATNVDNVQDNEISGAPIADGGPWIDIRFHLYTEDTTSPDDPQDPSYYGRTPILDGVEVIWREPGPIEVGDIPLLANVVVSEGEWNRVNHLKALHDECEQHGWEFRVRHDEAAQKLVLDLAESFGHDLTDSIVLRKGDNIAISRLQDSDEEYCNVLNVWGSGSGISRPYLRIVNQEAIDERGGEEVEADFEVDTDDPALMQQLGEEELERRSAIRPTYIVEAEVDPIWPPFQIGDTLKVVDPESGVVSDAEIVDEQREWGNQGERVTLALGGGDLANPIEALIRAQRTVPRGRRPPQPKPPSNVIPEPYIGGIRLKWAGGADAYEVEHTTEEDQSGNPINWTPLVRTTGIAYDHSGLAINSRHHYRIRAIVGGRTSDWVYVFAIANRKVSTDEIEGDFDFDVEVTSDPEPTSGDLRDLLDMDPSNAVTFGVAPTIEMDFPVVQGTDLVRIHLSTGRTGYVQAWNLRTETWDNVLGSASSPVQFNAGENVRQFDNGRMVFSRRYRIVLSGAVTVGYLKFWRTVLADEILTKILTLTGSMQIVNAAGTVLIDHEKAEFEADDGSKLTMAAGSLEIISSDGTMHFKDNRWDVYDENNVLRVKIGRLD